MACLMFVARSIHAALLRSCVRSTTLSLNFYQIGDCITDQTVHMVAAICLTLVCFFEYCRRLLLMDT